MWRTLGAASRILARIFDIGLGQGSTLKINTAEEYVPCILIILISPGYSDHGTFVYALLFQNQELILCLHVHRMVEKQTGKKINLLQHVLESYYSVD